MTRRRDPAAPVSTGAAGRLLARNPDGTSTLDALLRLASHLIPSVGKAVSLLRKELSVLRELHGDVAAKLERLGQEDPGLGAFLRRAHAYAVFPSVGKAAAVVGGAYGKGEVFRDDGLVGYAAVAQATIGIQLGGDTFVEVIAFENAAAFDRFRQGRWAFAANASAVLVAAGAAASADYEKGAAVFVWSEGGMLLEAAVGGQKFFFRPAVLGRLENARSP